MGSNEARAAAMAEIKSVLVGTSVAIVLVVLYVSIALAIFR